MPPFGILANHKIKMCHNSMKKIMIQKISQNNWNFWTVNLIMRTKKLLTSRQIFRYAIPAHTVTKKHCVFVSLCLSVCVSVCWTHPERYENGSMDQCVVSYVGVQPVALWLMWVVIRIHNWLTSAPQRRSLLVYLLPTAASFHLLLLGTAHHFTLSSF